jgi:hypothetical protein
MSMKNSNDTIWNQTSDLLICSAVPHSTSNKIKLLDIVGIMLHLSGVLCRMCPDKKYGDE